MRFFPAGLLAADLRACYCIGSAAVLILNDFYVY